MVRMIDTPESDRPVQATPGPDHPHDQRTRAAVVDAPVRNPGPGDQSSAGRPGPADRPGGPDQRTGPASPPDRSTGSVYDTRRCKHRTGPTGLADQSGPVEAPAWLRRLTSTVVLALSIITTVVAATGQYGLARWAGIHDPRSLVIPAGFEFTAVAFILMGYLRARAGHSPWPLWSLAIVVGVVSFYTNVVHAGPRAGMIFGFMSLVSLLLWFIKLGQDYRRYLKENDRTGLGKLWIFFPRIALRAVLIKQRLRRVEKTSELLAFADLWIAVYDDAKGEQMPDAKPDKKGRVPVLTRKMRARTAWRLVMVSANHAVADLPTSAEVQRINVIGRPLPAAPEPEPPVRVPSIAGDPVRSNEPPVAQWAADDAADRRKEIEPVSPAPKQATPEQLKHWAVLYADDLPKVRAGWRDDVGRDWLASPNLPSYSNIQALTGRGRTQAGRMQQVLIAERFAAVSD